MLWQNLFYLGSKLQSSSLKAVNWYLFLDFFFELLELLCFHILWGSNLTVEFHIFSYMRIHFLVPIVTLWVFLELQGFGYVISVFSSCCNLLQNSSSGWHDCDHNSKRAHAAAIPSECHSSEFWVQTLG